MTRCWLRRTLLCVAFGILMSVMVGWGCALFLAGARSTDMSLVDAELAADLAGLPRPSDEALVAGYEIRRPGELRRGITVSTAGQNRGSTTLVRYEQGWPLRCLSGEHLFGVGVPNGLSGGFLLPRRFLGHAHVLVFRPTLLPFVASVLIYGGPPWLVGFGLGFIRRAIRHRRGRCPTCGYNLHGEVRLGCSECGWRR